jgi:carbonic anhydrase
MTRMQSLIDGIRRYESVNRPRLALRFASLANGQSPSTLFITCADSRVDPNLAVSADPGELFVLRNIASLVHPTHPSSSGINPDAGIASGVWYALEVLGVRDVIVCGHSGCGGIKALCDTNTNTNTNNIPPDLQRWLEPARPSLDLWNKVGGYDPSRASHDQVSQMCTRHQLDHLLTYDCVRTRVERGSVRLHAWWFDIPAGQVLAYSEEAGRYVPAIEALESLSSLSPLSSTDLRKPKVA